MYSNRADLSEIENYRFFLDHVYKKIQNFKGNERHNRYHEELFRRTSLSASEDQLFDFYLEGKRVYLVIPKDISFQQFIKHLDYDFIYRPHYRNRYREAWYLRHNEPDFRQTISFTKNSSVIKEKKDNSAKQAWREETGLVRDKAKAYFKRSYKTFAKTHSNRSFRRDESKNLKSGNYDRLFARKVKLYFDPWDWD